jgi:hypothetical protein
MTGSKFEVRTRVVRGYLTASSDHCPSEGAAMQGRWAEPRFRGNDLKPYVSFCKDA